MWRWEAYFQSRLLCSLNISLCHSLNQVYCYNSSPVSKDEYMYVHVGVFHKILEKNLRKTTENCQVKVKMKSKVKSKLQRSKDQKLLWTFAYCIVISPPHLITACATTHPTLNFSNTSRGPTPKCWTFLETTHDPWLGSKLRFKIFAIFFATLSCKFFCHTFLQTKLLFTSRRPAPKCYTFLKTSHDPQL